MHPHTSSPAAGAAGHDHGYDEPHAGRAHLEAQAAQWGVPVPEAAHIIGRMFTAAWDHLRVAFRPVADVLLSDRSPTAEALRELHDATPRRFHAAMGLTYETCPFCPEDRLPDEYRLLRDLQVAEAAELLGIAQLTGLLRSVLAHQEEQMHDINDLRRAVASNNAADDAIVTTLESLRQQIRDMPKDRPLNDEEQAALDDAVDQLTAHTAALVKATTNPDTPSVNAPGAQPGGTVAITPPTNNVPDGPQGGTVNLDDEHPVATGGTQGTSIVDPGSSTAVVTADVPPAGTAADIKAQETKDAQPGDTVTEDGVLTTIPPGDAVVSNPGASVLTNQDGTGDEATVGDGPAEKADQPPSGTDPAAEGTTADGTTPADESDASDNGNDSSISESPSSDDAVNEGKDGHATGGFTAGGF